MLRIDEVPAQAWWNGEVACKRDTKSTSSLTCGFSCSPSVRTNSTPHYVALFGTISRRLVSRCVTSRRVQLVVAASASIVLVMTLAIWPQAPERSLPRAQPSRPWRTRPATPGR